MKIIIEKHETHLDNISQGVKYALQIDQDIIWLNYVQLTDLIREAQKAEKL